VAQFGPVRVAGPLAWLAWLGVHIAYLVGFQNRLLVLMRWTTSFLTKGRGSRLIGREGDPAGASQMSEAVSP
jgi:NADH dehydrogenase